MTGDTYAAQGGNLISIQLHTLTHRERHEGETEEDRACSQKRGGGEKVKYMLVHARKEDVSFTTHLRLQFLNSYLILQQQTLHDSEQLDACEANVFLLMVLRLNNNY